MIEGEWLCKGRVNMYLGSTKAATANCINDIKSRIAIAKWKMIELQDLWNDSTLPFQLILNLVKTLVWSALVYGAEALTLCKQK